MGVDGWERGGDFCGIYECGQKLRSMIKEYKGKKVRGLEVLVSN